MAVVRGYDYESVHGQRQPRAEFFLCLSARFSRTHLAGRRVPSSEKRAQARPPVRSPDFASVERTSRQSFPPCNTDAAGGCASAQIAQHEGHIAGQDHNRWPDGLRNLYCEIKDGAGEWLTIPFRGILSCCPLGNASGSKQ